MRSNPQLNGSDYLMLGFDHELRRQGFAGNGCQIVLELGTALSPAVLQHRLDALLADCPMIHARPGGLFQPHWKLPRRAVPAPRVRIHRDEPGRRQQAFNEPLAIHRGELMRFDLVERDGGRGTLIFSWTHALMDAAGAEHFLAVAGHAERSLPSPAAPPPRPSQPLTERCKLAWKNLRQLDQFCQAPPRSLGTRHPAAPRSLQYRVETFSPEETRRVRANGSRHCGVLGEAQFHAAVAVLELHQLHQRLGCPSPSYVLPVPVGLRPKGGIDPLFSNQLGMLMLQFRPGQLETTAHAVAVMKTQIEHAMRAGLLDSGRILSELFRFLPLPVYMAVLKHGLRGEICSLFYGDTAAVNPLLDTFLGAPILDFTHVAAVTPSPGLGVIFYTFRGGLRVTILHSTAVLDEAEAAGFAGGLRARLLDP